MLAVYVALYSGTTLQHTIGLIGIVMACYGWKSKFADASLQLEKFTNELDQTETLLFGFLSTVVLVRYSIISSAWIVIGIHGYIYR